MTPSNRVSNRKRQELQLESSTAIFFMVKKGRSPLFSPAMLYDIGGVGKFFWLFVVLNAHIVRLHAFEHRAKGKKTERVWFPSSTVATSKRDLLDLWQYLWISLKISKLYVNFPLQDIFLEISNEDVLHIYFCEPLKSSNRYIREKMVRIMGKITPINNRRHIFPDISIRWFSSLANIYSKYIFIRYLKKMSCRGKLAYNLEIFKDTF